MPSTMLIAAVAALLGDSAACQKSTGLDPVDVLRRAAESTGLPRSAGEVLKTTAFDIKQHAFESDRMYPPALAEVSSLDQWFDPMSGVERAAMHSTIGGYEFSTGAMGDARGSYALRDTTLSMCGPC
jgi:hypothetical protein